MMRQMAGRAGHIRHRRISNQERMNMRTLDDPRIALILGMVPGDRPGTPPRAQPPGTNYDETKVGIYTLPDPAGRRSTARR